MAKKYLDPSGTQYNINETKQRLASLSQSISALAGVVGDITAEVESLEEGLKPVAFSGSYSDLTNKPTVTNDIVYDSANKSLRKTKDGLASTIVNISTLKTDMELDNVGNFKAVSTAALQNLTDTEKANARTNIGLPVANNAGFHNNYFRGKDLTDVYTIDQMYSMIHSGKFDDLFLGDYFTKSMTTDIYTRFTGDSFASGTVYYEMGGTLTDRTWTETEDTAPQTGKIYATKTTKTENVTLMFAAFDYYYNIGDTTLTTHHAVLIPRGYGFATTAKMNSSNTTVGSYFNSDMHQIVLPCYAKALKTVLNNHLLAHRTILPNAINASTPSMAGAGMTGASNAWAWETVELQLMSEPQIYGTTVWSSSVYDVGVDYKKLPVFDFINGVQYGRSTCWLRSVVSSANFAACDSGGCVNGNGASIAFYVRPLILFG